MKKALLILISLALLCGSSAVIEISGENRYKSVILTPDIYNNANSNLSDLRVKNENGETVPYFITSHSEVLNFAPDFTIEEAEKITNIYIEGLKNLQLAEVTLYTDSMFKRVASAPFNVSKELHNLEFEGSISTDTTLEFKRNILISDIFTITINNGDDKPVVIDKITVKYYADELIFEGEAGKIYTLTFGDFSLSAPVYDIERYKDEILVGEIDSLELNGINIIAVPEAEPEKPDFTVLFNVSVAVVAAALAVVILIKLKRK